MTKPYLTVTALTKYIKRKLDIDPHLRSVLVKGEISNFKHHTRGHMYLTIKDDHSRIQAVMFAGNNRMLNFVPENGMQVFITGNISVFEATGQYQLYIQEMEPDGLGSLYLAFEQLKEKLRNKGYFSQELKKPIPSFPKHIGVITSPTGAAIRDILTTIKRRYPIVEITVIPVLVQGTAAATSISDAIKKANDSSKYDILIVGRGGGSIEELWSFNDEQVAEAIYCSTTPIISAVGHETDTTISDFVADLRAPTPTGAAELAVPSRQELEDKIRRLQGALKQAMEATFKQREIDYSHLKQAYAFKYPALLIQQKEQELDRMTEKLAKAFTVFREQKTDKHDNVYGRLLANHPKRQTIQAVKDLQGLSKRLNGSFQLIYDRHTSRLNTTLEKLLLVNPLAIMKRGFAIPYTTNGEILRTKEQIHIDDHIVVRITDGKLECQVINVEDENYEEE
ncbi:exodeoxyribonuclease VII large subunit [Virgibacillus sp. MG-45]|uniref:exodeoxyribonuclease VII large subunit n=1 Tax=Virgibacillus sp. MG-45 TaxID=3102791 RepID=UPI002EDA2B5C